MSENFATYDSDLSWATPSALRWLENFFSERWGGVWHLSRDPSETLTLRPASGGDASLVFSGGAFPLGTSGVLCGKWRISEPWRGAIYDELPTPGLQFPPAVLINKRKCGFRIYYDVLGFIFWSLTRSEEINHIDLDRLGRFNANVSHAKRYSYLQRPLVDEWLYVLAQAAEILWPRSLTKTPSPLIALSHDVDLPARYSFASYSKLLRRLAGDLLVRGEILNALKAPLVRLRSAQSISSLDPHNQFAWMMDVAESIGISAAFYFICGRTNADFDGDYEIEHPAIRELIRMIHERGHEIGLHPSFETYCDSDTLALESERLLRVCREERVFQNSFGGRMHYLRWKNPETLRAIVRAKLSYDATLGYADEPGFRCGTCIEYQAFDRIADESLPLRIRPLVAMEATIIETNNLGLGTGENAYELFNSLKLRCKAVGGTFSLLWHNSSLTLPTQRQLYKRIVND